MLYLFTSKNGNRLTLSGIKQQVNGFDVSEETFNRLLSELRAAEQSTAAEIVEIVIVCDDHGNDAVYANGRLYVDSPVPEDIADLTGGKPAYVRYQHLNGDFAKTFTQHTLGKPDSVVFPPKLQQLEPYFVDDGEAEPEPEPEPVEITCLCWVKLRNGSIAPITQRLRGAYYMWKICADAVIDTVAHNGRSDNYGEERSTDVIQVGEPLTDAEIAAAARGETLKYTGTMLK